MSDLSKSMFVNEAAYEEALAQGRGTTKAQRFLSHAAVYFERRPTNGEDIAHWANTYNAKNCREVAEQYDDMLEALKECCSYVATPISMLDGEEGAKRRTALLSKALAAIDKAEGR